MARTAETELSLIISAKNRASRVVSQVKKDVADASRSMTASLRSAGAGWGALGGGIDKTTGLLKALVPELGVPLTLLGTGLKTVALVASKAVGVVVGSVKTGLGWLSKLGEWVYNLPNRIMRDLWVLQWATSSIVRGLQNVALAAAAATAAVGYLLKQAIDAAAYLQQATIAYQSLLKSQALGTAFVGQLMQFAKQTPFEFKELLQLGRVVLAYGFSWQEVIPLLRQVGDATAALGGGPEMMERILRAIGQIRGKGKVMMQEMYQLAEAGIPVFEIFQQKLGLTQAQIANIGESGIPAGIALKALFEGINERYGGMMAKQMGTVAGQASNLKDILFQLRAAAGQPFLPMVQKGIGNLTAWLTALGPKLQAGTQWVVDFFAAFAKTKLAQSILGRWHELVAAVTGAMGTAGTPWQRFVGVVVWAATMLDRALGWLTNVVFAPGRIAGIIQWARDTYSGLLTWLGAAWTWLSTWYVYLRGLLAQALGFFAFWLGYLYALFSASWPQISAKVQEFWDALQRGAAWVYNNFPNMLVTVTGVAASIGKALLRVGAIAGGVRDVFVVAFNVIKLTVLGVLTPIFWAVQKLVELLAWAMDMMSNLPIGGQLFKGPAKNLHGAADYLKGLTQASSEGTMAAWNTIGGMGEKRVGVNQWYFDQLKGADQMRTWGQDEAAQIRAGRSAAATAPGGITVNIMAPVYGVDQLKQAIQDGITQAQNGARYSVAPG